MELLKDYDFELSYNPGKANIVADALSQKFLCATWIMLREEEKLKAFERLKIGVQEVSGTLYLSQLQISSDFKSEIEKAQQDDKELQKKVKIEYQRPSRTLQPLEIPQWKWESIAMDFVSGLPRTRADFDAVWVIVDRLTKSAQFLPIRMNYTLEELARLYIKEIVRLHVVPSTIISDKDPRFTSRFWGTFQRAFGTWLSLSIAYHPQIDGQSERIIQTLEDMLRACVLDQLARWDQMLTAQSCQKSYADQRRKPLKFEEGDYVFLKFTSTTRVDRAIKMKKLNPRYIGPFQILERVGPVAYGIALPPHLSNLHNVFHLPQL
ncbi:uncharacterized protein LOC110265328 [Arachis ipaensis]|uniref:uncharacterized protein LOC110265328 n=1 Tax=Arachis ipaensis TaxID=130454 RepID=UPI000A2B5AED|nr:uncharacterized protein LOC110265328 [Arachis ipaensis]XP_025670353.1 uncharacterized protein LOC112770156 [Arachis hypogaea]